jgi:hypothetical protein
VLAEVGASSRAMICSTISAGGVRASLTQSVAVSRIRRSLLRVMITSPALADLLPQPARPTALQGEADKPVPPGAHQVDGIRLRGRRPRQSGRVRLYIDGNHVGEGKLPTTVPLIFSEDETVDLGRDTGSPVSDDYTPTTSVFTGTVG